MRLLFVENNDSFSRNVMALLPAAPRVVSAAIAMEHFSWAEAVVLGPGPGTPEALVPLVHEAARRRLPTLGICLGHQALGVAFGGRLTRTTPTHGKVSQVTWHPNRLFSGHFGQQLEVMRYHSLCIENVQAPLEVVSTTIDGVVMALAHQSLPMVGFQFHPDSYATPAGPGLVRAFFGASGPEPLAVGLGEPVPRIDAEQITLDSLKAPFALLAPGFSDGTHWVLLEDLYRSDEGEVGLWLCESETPARQARRWAAKRVRAVQPVIGASGSVAVQLDEIGAVEAIEAIREAIAAGDVYQVNYTLRAALQARDGAALLGQLCRKRVPRFAAWVHLGDEEHVSASPELLFRLDAQGRLRCEPMKGTSAVGTGAELLDSDKDAAELAMIVDLTRDDLHRVCQPGSVHVTSPRRMVQLPYAIQTVADVEGLLRPSVGLREVVATFHPGGSVTGAPRAAAITTLQRLESTPRGLYCGSVGLESGGRACFSVAIRTASKRAEGQWTYGVGSGITWDSDPQAELAEIRLKLGAVVG